MIKGPVTLSIVSILVVVSITLWIFTARIVSALLPPLLNSDTIEITALDITAIGLRTVEIRRLAGHARMRTGTAAFDIENATVFYDLRRLAPGEVTIEHARVEHSPVAILHSEGGETAIFLPPEVSVELLHFIYGDIYEFKGPLDIIASGEAFTFSTADEHSFLQVSTDAALSAFDLSLADTNQERIGWGRIEVVDSEIESFEFSARLGPALNWSRDSNLLPLEITRPLNDIESAAGELQAWGRRNDNGQWAASIDLDLQRIATPLFYTSGVLAGDLRLDEGGWTFTWSRAGDFHLTTVDELVADVYSLSAALPKGYAIGRGILEGNVEALAGSGVANVAFYRSGDLDLKAEMTRWYLHDRQQAHIELRGAEFSDPIQLSVENLDASINLSDAPPLLASGTATISGAHTHQWPAYMTTAQLQADWEWRDDSLDIKGVANLGGPPEADWTLSIRDNSGEARVELDTTVQDLIKPFRKYLDKNQYDVRVLQGSATGLLTWTWNNDHYDNRFGLSVTGAEGRFLGLDFKDAALEIKSSDLVTPALKLEGRFPSIDLANNVKVEDLAVSGRWQSGFHLDQAEMSVLGGQVKIIPTFISADSPELSVDFEVSEIGLEQIFEMIDRSGLEGSGKLSGTIPVRLKQSAIAIDDGRLKNTTTGHISYNAGEESSPQFDNIAVQALEDFRYELLDATLNYQFSGDYSIIARIEGRNPSLYDGFPVAFNVNLSGKLPGLLAASLLTGDFDREILRKIREQQ